MKRIFVNSILFGIVFIIVGLFFIRHNSFSPLIDRGIFSSYDSLPRLRIATPYPFLGSLISVVGDDKVDILYMRCDIDDATCIDSFQESISNSNIRAFFALGLASDEWAKKFSEIIPVIFFSDLFTWADYNVEGADNLTPYFWLSPINVQKMVDVIARTLAQIDSLHREFYISNAYDYGISLTNARREARDLLVHSRRRPLFVYGHLWSDFLRDIELSPRGVIDYASSTETVVARVLSSVDSRKDGFLIDNQFPIDVFVARTASRPFLIAQIDPLGDLFNSGYIDMFRYNVAQIARVVLP